MLEASARWGSGARGKEQISVPVCKVKYQPFREATRGGEKNRRLGGGLAGKGRRGHGAGEGGTSVGDHNRQQQEPQEKMFACHLHHYRRKKNIEKAGPRQGWQSFSAFHGSATAAPPEHSSGGERRTGTTTAAAVAACESPSEGRSAAGSVPQAPCDEGSGGSGVVTVGAGRRPTTGVEGAAAAAAAAVVAEPGCPPPIKRPRVER
ncbi:expressed unknown protein [Ectocarpus siliculosus]|uniref:Uncharacterized protein n=1 Tax=Ectocarpus siliculosus TaxID=2880 RepID=D8LM35_ECTSI|nr:expressed unknown protein [Ectocarpus siliculosus]|eukprot:CBN77249.1 expressed unknown protein [Ectocarpus siliculosus]